MEAVAALSLACNVIQIIGTAISAAETVHQTYKYGTSIDNDHLERTLGNLLALNLEQNTSGDAQLNAVSKDCILIANELIKELSLLKGTGKRDILKKSFRAMRRKGEIEKLKTRLDDHERTLNTGLLVRLRESTDAAKVIQQSHFTQLDGKLQVFIAALANGNTRIESLLKAEAHSTNQVIAKQHDQTRQLMQNLQLKTVTDQQKQQFLGSLKYASMNARRNQISATYPDTFEWIFSNNDKWKSFPEWLKSKATLFYVEGKAASGKSTLVKFIIEDQRTSSLLCDWNSTTKVISHFFWLAGEPMQRSLHGLLASLIYQILANDEVALSTAIQTDKEHASDWSISELKSCLIKLLGTGYYCIFIDGFDELQEKDFEAFESLTETLLRMPNIKMCISSRPEVFHLRHLHPDNGIRLQDLTKGDIEKYVASRLAEAQKSGRLAKTTTVDDSIISDIVKQANGVFLWVHLALNSVLRGLRNQASMAELQSRLLSLPTDIEQLYEDALRRQGEDWSLLQVEAALYFMVYLHGFTGNDIKHYESSNSQLFFYAVASKLGSILSEVDTDAIDLEAEVYRAFNRIPQVCAGFLEIPVSKESEIQKLFPIGSKQPDDSLPLDKYRSAFASLAGTEVTFTHRTAFDFIVQQPIGQQILATCPLNEFDIWYRSEVANEVRRRWKGDSISWDGLTMVVLQLNMYNEAAEKVFECLRYLRQCYLDGARSGRCQKYFSTERWKFIEDYISENGSPASYEWEWILKDLRFDTYELLLTKSSDFIGLTLELGRPEYFQFTLGQYMKKHSLEGNLTQEYLDYLLYCTALSYATGNRAVDMSAHRRSRLHGIIRLLLQHGANPHTIFWENSKVSRTYLSKTAASLMLCHHSCLAISKSDVKDIGDAYAARSLLWCFANTEEPFTYFHSMEIMDGAFIRMELPANTMDLLMDENALLEFQSARTQLFRSHTHLKRELVLVTSFAEIAVKVPAEQSAPLLCTLEQWIDSEPKILEARNGSDTDSDENEFEMAWLDTIVDLDWTNDRVETRQWLIDNGYVIKSSDYTEPYGPIQRFCDGVDTSKIPEW